MSFAQKLIMRIIRFSIRIFLGISLILLLVSFSKKKVYQCKRQKSIVEINAFNIIWEGEYHFDTKSQMHYGLTNDDHYLYVGMKTSDETLKRKIMMAGLTFWIDTNARGKQQLGLMFPLQQKPDPGKMRNSKGDSQNTKNEREKSAAEIKKFNEGYLRNFELMDIIGFGGKTELSASGNINKDGVSAILHIDSTEFMYYFACIPLELIFDKPDDYLKNPDKLFSFAFKTNKLEMPSNGTGGGPPQGGGGSQGGRPQGGGPQGGSGSQPGMQQMQELSQPSVLSVKKAMLSDN